MPYFEKKVDILTFKYIVNLLSYLKKDNLYIIPIMKIFYYLHF